MKAWLPPAPRPRSSVTTCNRRPALRREAKEAYEADERNPRGWNDGRSCLGAEPRHYREHQKHHEGGAAEERDRFQCCAGGIAVAQFQAEQRWRYDELFEACE